MRMNKLIKNTLAVLFILFLLLNAMAFMHAWKMTRFTASGDKPIKPEHLTFRQKAKLLFTGVAVPKPETLSAKPSFKYETINLPGYKGTILEAWLTNGKKPDSIVILFHGYIESKIQLIPEAEKFHSKGYDVMLVDFFGSGGSEGSRTGVGYHEAEDVKAAYEKAKLLGYKKIILFGVSMGSAAVMKSISQYGIAPDGLIIESPFAGLLDTVRLRFKLMNAPSWPFSEILVFWGSIISGYNGFTYNPWKYAKDITVPVLLLHGAKDKRVSNAQAKLIFDNLAGEKKMVIFPEGGHLSFMNTDEKTWDANVMEFIK